MPKTTSLSRNGPAARRGIVHVPHMGHAMQGWVRSVASVVRVTILHTGERPWPEENGGTRGHCSGRLRVRAPNRLFCWFQGRTIVLTSSLTSLFNPFPEFHSASHGAHCSAAFKSPTRLLSSATIYHPPTAPSRTQRSFCIYAVRSPLHFRDCRLRFARISRAPEWSRAAGSHVPICDTPPLHASQSAPPTLSLSL